MVQMINRMKTSIIAFALKWLHRVHRTSYVAKIDGKKFFICRGVFNPIWTLTGRFLAKNLTVREGDFVLDLGTGSGILAIFAAERAKRVIATDINPLAVGCAKINVRMNSLEEKIEVREGNLFEPVKRMKFDLILFSPPYPPGRPKSVLESSWFDDGSLITRFFREVEKHLKPNGRIQLVYSTLGDVPRLIKLFELGRFRVRIVSEMSTLFERIFVYELKKEKAAWSKLGPTCWRDHSCNKRCVSVSFLFAIVPYTRSNISYQATRGIA